MAQSTIDGQLDIFAVPDTTDREERTGDLPIHFATEPTLTPNGRNALSVPSAIMNTTPSGLWTAERSPS